MNCRACGHDAAARAHFCEQCGMILSREDPMHHLAFAYRLEMAGKPEEAVEEYEKLLERELPSSEAAVVCKHAGNLHFRLGHLRKALAHLTRACDTAPDNATFWHDRGVVEYQMADFDAAVRSFRKALEEDPHLQLGYFWLGNSQYHRGELEEACRSFRELLDRYPNFTIARFHMGVIYARMGRKDRSQAEFRKVLRKNPADAAAKYWVEH